MKIAFNPSTVAALTSPPNNKDITFDLRGQNIFAQGVKFYGTDTWRPVVDNLTSNSPTSSLSANQGRVLAGLINGKSDSDHNHDGRYLKLTGGILTGNLIGTSAMFSGRFYGNGDDEGIIIKPSSNGYAGLILGTHNGERSIFYFVKNKPFWRYSHGSDNLDIIHPKKSGTIALTSDIPSSVKNPYSLTTFGVVYDGSAEKVVSPSNFISQLEEGTSVVTDGTMFVTSLASDKGFADTNAVNAPYKRKAARLWDYIKAKTDTLYSALGHNHDNKYLRWFGNAGQPNMNAIGRISHSSGMTYLGDPGNTTDNPMEGNIKSTSWHLYWQTNYIDNPGGSNAWVAQIVNRAGTDRWWVRSRSGGTITNGTGWTSNWRFLVTAPTSGLGNGNQPVYINSAGEVVAANSYPTSLKSPHSLTLKANGTTLAIYDGSSAKEANFTYANVGAASASHTHSYYAVNENYGGFKKAERLPTSGFYQSEESESGGNAPWKSWMHLINCQHSNPNNNYALQIAASFYDNNTFKIRVTNCSVNSAWRDIIHSGNISSQSVASASKLQTARNIWGQSFDGTTNVDNTLRIRKTTGNYCEGIRIQTSDGAWSTIILGATSDSGTNANAWSIHRKSDNNFAISRNSSDGANGLVMTSVGMGLGTTSPIQRLDVNGNIRTTGDLYITHATNNNMNHDTSNPRIVFSDRIRQAVGLVYTDYDSYRASKGLKVMDVDNDCPDNVWFEVQGYNYSSGYVKNGSNNNYVLLGGGGHKAESSLRVAYASNADMVDGYHADNIQSAGWRSLYRTGGSSGVIKWTRIGRCVSPVGDSSDNDGMIEFHTNGDQNYKYFGHGKMQISQYGPSSKSLMLSSVTSEGIHFYATIDSSNYIWLGHNAWWSGNSAYRVIWSGSYIEWYSSDMATSTEAPNSTYIIDNGTFKYPNEVGQVIANNTAVSWYKVLDKIVAGNEFNVVNAGYNDMFWFNYLPINDRNNKATISTYCMGNGQQGYASVTASGFHHQTVNSDNYMLLAGGGYKSFGGDASNPIFLGYLNLDHGNDGTVSSSFSCLGYSVPFTYTRGGNYCRIYIPDTTHQIFYIKAATASVNYSGGGMDTWVGYHRGSGAWWLHCYASGTNEVRVKGFRQANDNNDSWWGGNPLVSANNGANRITVCIFGYVNFR